MNALLHIYTAAQNESVCVRARSLMHSHTHARAHTHLYVYTKQRRATNTHTPQRIHWTHAHAVYVLAYTCASSKSLTSPANCKQNQHMSILNKSHAKDKNKHRWHCLFHLLIPPHLFGRSTHVFKGKKKRQTWEIIFTTTIYTMNLVHLSLRVRAAFLSPLPTITSATR